MTVSADRRMTDRAGKRVCCCAKAGALGLTRAIEKNKLAYPRAGLLSEPSTSRRDRILRWSRVGHWVFAGLDVDEENYEAANLYAGSKLALRGKDMS